MEDWIGFLVGYGFISIALHYPLKPSDSVILYQLPANWRIAVLEDQIPHTIESAGTTSTAVQILDSFDWRLYRAGVVLTAETRGRRLQLRCMEAGGRKPISLLLPRMPRFTWDFPRDHRLRKLLEPRLEMRALLPLAKASLKRQEYKLLNRDGKTVLRLEQETLACGEKTIQLLRVWRMRGYPKPFALITRILKEGTSPLSELDLANWLLGSSDRKLLDYSSKVELTLNDKQTAEESLRGLFLGLLTTMERNLEGTLQDWDSEFLHDFRVAVRRTRSGIAQVKGVYKRDALNRYRDDFAWLGSLTGPTRDLDVYLLKFEAYRHRLPSSSRDDLLPFRTFLQQRQVTAQKKLARGLQSSRYQKLVKDWRAFLQAPPAAALAGDAASPVRDVASRQIWRLYSRVMKEGAAIVESSPPDALHDLRKTCKKLRYLLEFFRSLYDAQKVQLLIRSLKRLQDNLGDFQDYEVQAAAMREFGRDMLSEGDGSAETMMAMGILVVELEQQQSEARRAFAGRFEKFAKPGVRKMFGELFREPHEGGTKS